MTVDRESVGSHVTVAIIGGMFSRLFATAFVLADSNSERKAGMAGLLLCQALRKRGISAEVYERASSKNARFEGYRLG